MKLILLDRDGVINHDSDQYIKSPDEWHAIPGSLEAISRLTQNEYEIIVISNQSGIGRKLLTIEDLNAIHHKMYMELDQFGGKINSILFCPHIEGADCDCQKPKPGLFEQIRDRLNISLEGVPYVGDKLSDIQVAEAVGAKPILVKTGYGKKTLELNTIPESVEVFDDLAAAVDQLLA